MTIVIGQRGIYKINNHLQIFLAKADGDETYRIQSQIPPKDQVSIHVIDKAVLDTQLVSYQLDSAQSPCIEQGRHALVRE